jgi:predicted nucleotidyltransferase
MDEIAQGLRLLAEHRVECVIVGGVAGWAHGSSQATVDVDVRYSREASNVKRLIQALRSVRATLRGAPRDISFILDEETLRRGLNFTSQTEIGDLDLLGEVRGVGSYDDCLRNSATIEMFGHAFSLLSLKKLIDAKRAAGRSKDLMALPELEALLEHERARNRDIETNV